MLILLGCFSSLHLKESVLTPLKYDELCVESTTVGMQIGSRRMVSMDNLQTYTYSLWTNSDYFDSELVVCNEGGVGARTTVYTNNVYALGDHKLLVIEAFIDRGCFGVATVSVNSKDIFVEVYRGRLPCGIVTVTTPQSFYISGPRGSFHSCIDEKAIRPCSPTWTHPIETDLNTEHHGRKLYKSSPAE